MNATDDPAIRRKIIEEHHISRFLPSTRYSELFIEQLASLPNYGITPSFIFVLEELKALEDRAQSRTKKPGPFKGDILKGLNKKHYSLPIAHSGINARLALGFHDPKNKDFQKYAGKILDKYSGMNMSPSLAHEISSQITEQMMKRIQQRRVQNQTTGDYIVYCENEGLNYYLCLSTHGKDNETRLMVKSCFSEFPFLKEIEAFKTGFPLSRE